MERTSKIQIMPPDDGYVPLDHGLHEYFEETIWQCWKEVCVGLKFDCCRGFCRFRFKREKL